jgi:uncharacterized membrane protein
MPMGSKRLVQEQQGPVQEPQRLAKEPVTVLAGPYGHPLHAALVALPIGAWVSSVVLDIASHLLGRQSAATAAHAAWWLVGLGVLGALAAATVGMLDFLALPPGTRVHRVGLAHLTVNLGATALFTLSWALRRGDPDPVTGTPPLPLAVSLLGLLAITVGGWLGGELAYRYGVRVADETTQARGFTSSRRGHRRTGRASDRDEPAPGAGRDELTPTDRPL